MLLARFVTCEDVLQDRDFLVTNHETRLSWVDVLRGRGFETYCVGLKPSIVVAYAQTLSVELSGWWVGSTFINITRERPKVLFRWSRLEGDIWLRSYPFTLEIGEHVVQIEGEVGTLICTFHTTSGLKEVSSLCQHDQWFSCWFWIFEM